MAQELKNMWLWLSANDMRTELRQLENEAWIHAARQRLLRRDAT